MHQKERPAHGLTDRPQWESQWLFSAWAARWISKATRRENLGSHVYKPSKLFLSFLCYSAICFLYSWRVTGIPRSWAFWLGLLGAKEDWRGYCGHCSPTDACLFSVQCLMEAIRGHPGNCTSTNWIWACHSQDILGSWSPHHSVKRLVQEKLGLNWSLLRPPNLTTQFTLIFSCRQLIFD